MPIDDRWDALTDHDWTEFAACWLEQLRRGVVDDEPDYGGSVTMMGFTARAEHKWKFVLAAVRQAQTDDELGQIAAGPIEYLLGKHGADYIDAVEAKAKADPKFARAMTGVWQYLMTDDIWARVRAIQEQAEPLGT